MSVICCVLCGLTAIDLPEDHHCRPNLSPAELQQLRRPVERLSFDDLFHRRRVPRPAPEARPLVSSEGRFPALLRTVADSTEGSRNSTLHWASCRTAEMIAEGTLPDPWSATEALAGVAASAGLEPREIAGTIRSGFSTTGVVL